MTVRSKTVKQGMEEGGRWEGKKSGGMGKGEEEVNRESIHIDGHHVTKFLTKFAYEWYCMTMCTCIILTSSQLTN